LSSWSERISDSRRRALSSHQVQLPSQILYRLHVARCVTPKLDLLGSSSNDEEVAGSILSYGNRVARESSPLASGCRLGNDVIRGLPSMPLIPRVPDREELPGIAGRLDLAAIVSQQANPQSGWQSSPELLFGFLDSNFVHWIGHAEEGLV
jgi:hypothetical protein